MTTPYRIHGHPKPPLQAAGDLSGNQFRFVKAAATEGRAAAITAANDRAVAVQADKPWNNDPGDFVAFGVAEIEAGGAVPFGAEITSDAQGRAIVAGSGTRVYGWALTAAGASGQRLSAFVNLVNPPRVP